MPKISANPEGAKTRRVFMVELFIDLPDTPQITFFGSKKAIFEYFGNEVLRITYSHSRNINFATKHYQNAVCRIEEGELFAVASKQVIDRRNREGREPLPQSNTAGTIKMNANNKKDKEG